MQNRRELSKNCSIHDKNCESIRHLDIRSGEHIGVSPLTGKKVKPSNNSAICDHFTVLFVIIYSTVIFYPLFTTLVF